MSAHVNISNNDFEFEQAEWMDSLEYLKSKDQQGEHGQQVLQRLAMTLQHLLVELENPKQPNNLNLPSSSNIGMDEIAGSNQNQGPSDAELITAMAQMAQMISLLQVEIGKASKNKSDLDQQMANETIQSLQAKLQDLETQAKQLLAEQNKNNVLGTILKVVEGVAGGVIAGIALLAGQPELAVMIVVLTTLAISGALDKVTTEFSSGLQQLGVSPEAADAIAKVAVVAITVLVTLGVGSEGAAEEVLDDALENSTEAATQVSTAAGRSAAEAADGVAEDAGEQAETLTQKLQRLNPFRSLSKSTNMAILAGAQVASTVNPFSAIVAALPIKDQHLKNILEVVATVLQDLLCMIAGAGAGAAAATSSAASQLLSTANVMKGLFALQAGGGLTQAGLDAGVSANDFSQAKIMSKMAEDQANVYLYQSMYSEINQGIQNSQKHTADTIKEQNQMVKSFSNLTAGWRAFAELLA